MTQKPRNEKRRRRPQRSNKPPSLEILVKRLRDIWIDGHSCHRRLNFDKLRHAMQIVAADDGYWRDLETLAQTRERANALAKQMKERK